jgi:hypothetical protein
MWGRDVIRWVVETFDFCTSWHMQPYTAYQPPHETWNMRRRYVALSKSNSLTPLYVNLANIHRTMRGFSYSIHMAHRLVDSPYSSGWAISDKERWARIKVIFFFKIGGEFDLYTDPREKKTSIQRNMVLHILNAQRASPLWSISGNQIHGIIIASG